MHRKFLLQRIGLFLLLRFVILVDADDGQRKCRSNVCFNGGTCVVEDRGSNEAPVFECLCPDGFGGTLCEEAMSCSLDCQNGGECRFKEGKPFCSCKQGFGGPLCQNKVGCQQSGCPENEICLLDLAENEFKCQANKCIDRPCKNGATCRAIPNDYICECSSKWRGRNCEEDINECEEDEPCLNSGECKNLVGDFKCICPSPFTGKICEQRSGFCVQKPCKHGRCEELEDNFRCVCDEGYFGPMCDRMKPTLSCEKPRVLVETEGGISKCILCPEGSKNCENSIEECTVDGLDCKNDGLCIKNGEGTNFCKCTPEFSGRWCENQIVDDHPSNKTNSCTPTLCQNNGVCSDDEGFAKCTCLETHTGQFCQLGCTCPKESVCRENLMKPGQVECLRVESLSSANTDQLSNTPSPFASFSFVDLPDFQFEVANISSCDDCFNAQKCVYADKRLMCLCPISWSGPVCAERVNPCTSMKCSGNQICRLRRTSFGDTPYCACPDGTSGTNCQRKLPPATFGPNSVAVIQVPTQSDSREGEFSLEFTFRSTVPNTHLATGESILNELDFLLELVDGYLNLRLGDHTISDLVELRLNDADWYTVVLKASKDMDLLFELHDAETGYVLAHKLLGHHTFNAFTVRFGRRKQSSFFTGCLREIRINRMPIDVFSKDRSVDVLQGCQFQPQCKTDSCGHGTCVELWNSFRCECRRPYLPPNCVQELQEATFGSNNLTSNLVYSLQPDTANSLASNTEFSFLVRTNKPEGQIFYIGQNGEDDTSTFISCGLQNGTVALDSRLGGKRVQKSRGRRRIDDNIQHLVEVKRRDNNFTIYVDGSKDGEILITRPFAHPLIVDRVALGGENPQLSFNQSDESLFKGTLQDIRLNDKNLVLGESTPNFLLQNQSVGTQLMRQNLIMGTISDDLCAKKPCVQGSCTNTFNDYYCTCQKGWMGKNCDQVDFCSSNPCAFESAQCINTHGGYVCKAPATFSKTSQVKFLLKQSKAQLKMNESLRFTFAIRTRTPSAQIVKLNTIDESLSMELKDETVVFRYTNQSTTTEDPLSVHLNNGQWHSVEIFEQADGQLLASFDNTTVPLLNQFSFVEFVQSNDSWLTFGRSQNATGFKGCLHNVRFGDLPELSFFAQADSGIRSLNGTRHFESRSLQNIRSDGCHSKDLCGPTNFCRNGALCRDLFNLRKCECSPGFTGDLCEINVDECADNKDCGSNGKCVDGVNAFSCACKPGYSGPLCTTELDQCVANPCKNGASCKTEDGRAVCSCTNQFLGITCKVKRNAKCKDNPCNSNNTLSCVDTEDGFKCECDVLVHGDLCEESVSDEMCAAMPCQHGGTCVPAANGTVECICPQNYEGQFCQSLKNTCKKGICGHGKCRPVFGGHLCECEEGWEGLSCNVDINECLDEFPCTNNGSCLNTNGSYECTCPKFYLGKNCEIAGVCSRSPCKNSAECIQKSATEYRCECLPGYTGRNCETEIDYCADEPCLNGATCQRQIGSFKCHCIAGFTGQRCEEDIDDCAQNEACQHGGQCLDRVNGFECNCLNTGWHGQFCELDLDECQQPDLCQNGQCKNLPGSYECACKEGFIGASCSMVDPCVLDSKNRTLHNCVHGSCVDPRVVQQPSGRYVAEYTCRCYESYTGQFCTHVELIRKPISIGYILGPGVALLIVSILLVCMLFFFVARNRRANQGTYSPSTHEMNGAARVQMHTLQTPLKKQERLI